MTFKNTTKIALLFSILVLPIAITNVNADGTAEIVPTCGFEIPDDIPLGMIYYGVDTEEVNFSINVDGNAHGTLSLAASNWLGTENVGNHAYQNVQVTGPFSTSYTEYELIIPGVPSIVFLAVGGFTNQNNAFDISSNDPIIIAEELKDTINAHPSISNYVTASIINTSDILVEALIVGTDGNQYSSTSDHGISTSSSNFVGGTNDFSVLPAETTRYAQTSDGNPSSGIPYSGKTSLWPAGQTKVITPSADPDLPINLSFQLTGVDVLDDVDYFGAITQNWTFTYACTE